jgi:dUTP pyrophosphatase
MRNNQEQHLNVLKLTENAKLPTRNNKTDAGLDLYCIESVFIPVGSTKIVKTGISISIPVGHVGKIEDRSSMAAKGLRTGGGVIDAGYTGEVGVIIHNLTNTTGSSSDGRGYLIESGQKIAQLLIYKVETPDVLEVKETWTSDRGEKGFGSSGV